MRMIIADKRSHTSIHHSLESFSESASFLRSFSFGSVRISVSWLHDKPDGKLMFFV